MSPIVRVQPLGFPWETIDPFLFCVHHDDAYPRANEALGPAASLAGRAIGQDFSRKDGWSMYHGDPVPGFPAHPHRGFETVTIVRNGYVDHADSLGAAARYGPGDVQWLTAGAGVVHSEMFPLLQAQQDNPLELFQIWLNLPARSKMAAPHFTMFWSADLPRRVLRDEAGRDTQITLIAGQLAGAGEGSAPPPPPDSWAAHADADVAIWTIRMAPGARWRLPAAQGRDTRRMLYFFRGATLDLDARRMNPPDRPTGESPSPQREGHPVRAPAAIEVVAGADIDLVNGDQPGELLLLQGRPIGEPVVQHGPFVMNTQAEILQAFADYRRTQFGGWPWPDAAPVHGRAPTRFARHPDGRDEHPGAAAPAAAGMDRARGDGSRA